MKTALRPPPLPPNNNLDNAHSGDFYVLAQTARWSLIIIKGFSGNEWGRMIWLKTLNNRGQIGETVMSWLGKIKAAQAELATRNVDPWQLPLARLHGKIDYDGLERVSSQTLMDILEVPQRSRTAGTYRHLAKIMAELGWTAVRVRDLTRGGYKEQVRGYCRDARCRSNVPNRECAPVGSNAPV